MPLERPPVFILLAQRGPAHITRLVIALAINSVKRVLRRRLASNMREECREVIQPFSANGDTSTAVEIPASILLVEASRFHVGPRAILGGIGSAVGKTRLRQQMLCVKTSATSRSAFAKTLAYCGLNATAVAAAFPPNTAAFCFIGVAASDHQPSESLTCQVYRYAHTRSL